MSEVTERTKVSLSVLTYDQLVVFRNQIGAKITEADAVVTDLKAKRERIDQELLRRFNEQGVSNVKTNHGTPYIIERTSCSAEDKDTFMSWVRNTNAWDFLEIRPNKTMVSQYKEEHGDIPPGLNWTAKLTIGVTGKKA